MGKINLVSGLLASILLVSSSACLPGSESSSSEGIVLNVGTPLPGSEVEPEAPAKKSCVPGIAVDCKTLAGLWQSGSKAVCDVSGNFYNVSSCVRITPTKANSIEETVYPAQRSTRWINAKCNKTSDFAFEISMPRVPSGIWVINLEGGGACVDGTSNPGAGCAVREEYNVAPVKTTGVAFGKDRSVVKAAVENEPDFENAIRVKAHYCSSDLWTGTNTVGFPVTWGGQTSNWPFTGALNVKAMLDILTERYGLSDADPKTTIMLRGTSAGGWGVINNIAEVKRRFPKTAAAGKLMASSWSGFQITDFARPGYGTWGYVDANGNALSARAALAVMKNSWKSSLYPPCVLEHLSSPQDCITGEVMLDYIIGPESSSGLDIPLLVFQNAEDQLYMTLHSVPPLTNNISTPDLAARAEYKATMKAAMGVNDSFPNVSTRVKWLFAVSDPVKNKASGTGLEPNVHPPICYLDNPPDGPQNSLMQMYYDFWATRGQGPGRGLVPGRVQTYNVNYVTSPICP